jgi:CBS domain-containing protein
MPTVSDIMTRCVEVVTPDDTLQHVARRMGELDVGAMPVCRGAELLGIVTDRDITVRATAAGLAPGQACVRDVMTSRPLTCAPHQPADEAAALMGEICVRRLPVVDDDGALIGIVSLGDVAARPALDIGAARRALAAPLQPQRNVA